VAERLIDLGEVADRGDRVGGRPRRRRWASAKAPVGLLLAAFVLGLVAGWAAYHVRELEQRRAEAQQEPSVLLWPGAVGASRSDGRLVTFDAQVTAVNDGTTAVRVGDLRAQQEGFTMASSPRVWRIEAGRLWTFNVTVTWDCTGRFPYEVLPVGMSVERAGGRPERTSSSLVLRDSGWREFSEGVCGRFG
jgi:hypothetical protein